MTIASKYNSKITENFLKESIEDQYFDRKSSRIKPKDIAQHLCAFANGNGGCLAIGIPDNEEIEGFNDLGDDKINDLLKVSFDLCQPTPKYKYEILEINNKSGMLDKVLLFHVEPSSIKNLKYTRYSRNPKIARVLSEFGWVKELNEGVKRIYKEMSDYFLDEPKFSEANMNSLKLTLKNNIVMRKIRNKEQMSAQFTTELWDTLSSDEITAIELAYKHNKVTTKMLEEEIDRGTKFARKVLNDLVEKEILDWNGTSKTDPKQYYSFK